LALELRRDGGAHAARLAAINDSDTFELVQRERALTAQLGADDSPLGVTLQRHAYGDIEFVRGEHQGQPLSHVRLLRRGAGLPSVAHATQLWTGDDTGTALFERLEINEAPRCWTARTGLLVARSEALPEGSRISDAAVVWTAGLTTWRRLAARGYWVTGSDESLGETAAAAVRELFPDVTHWVKLSHELGFDTPLASRIATYRLQPKNLPEPVHNHTHFFWRSGSQFREYLRAFPGLAQAWHGSGPGNTLRIVQGALGSARVKAFLSAQQFRAELSP
jgi:hydroxymethylbilane synthase